MEFYWPLQTSGPYFEVIFEGFDSCTMNKCRVMVSNPINSTGAIIWKPPTNQIAASLQFLSTIEFGYMLNKNQYHKRSNLDSKIGNRHHRRVGCSDPSIAGAAITNFIPSCDYVYLQKLRVA